MDLTRALMVALLVAALGLPACAGSMATAELYPEPRPWDLPIGIDEGLISSGWDGGHPVRLLAFFLYPAGIVADLLWNQPAYLIASQAPNLFGYTTQDEKFRQDYVLKHKHSWTAPQGPLGVIPGY